MPDQVLRGQMYFADLNPAVLGRGHPPVEPHTDTQSLVDIVHHVIIQAAYVLLQTALINNSHEHIVKRVSRHQAKETCMYCNVRGGYDYRIIHRKKRMGDDQY